MTDSMLMRYKQSVIDDSAVRLVDVWVLLSADSETGRWCRVSLSVAASRLTTQHDL